MKNTYKLIFESLEPRDLPSVVAHALPVAPVKPAAFSIVLPEQMRVAYGFNHLYKNTATYNANAGKGITVGITDAYTDPNLVSSVNTFDIGFHLPPLRLTEVHPDGNAGPDPAGNWNFETCLDVQWVHALLPAARILLVDAAGASFLSMINAETYALGHSNIVSNSWGTGAVAGDSGLNSFFLPNPGTRTAVLASSGDNRQLEAPAHLVSVLSIGGTTLNLKANGGYIGERLWPDSGPRGFLGFDADPLTGVPVQVDSKWYQIGGTSLSCPCWSTVIGLADQLRRAKHLPFLTTADIKADMPKIPKQYLYHGHGIPGLGSPIVNKLVPALAQAKALPQTKIISQAPIPHVIVKPLYVIA